jgi:hypothetical protein
MRQDLGKLQGQLELYIKQQEEDRKELKEELKGLRTDILEIKTEFETYKTVARVFKYIGLSILALMTFKLGDAVQQLAIHLYF